MNLLQRARGLGGLSLLLLAMAAPGAVAAEFVPLFNGRDLTGWTNVNCAPGTWTAIDGLLHSTGVPIGELRTTRMYQNFILELEWRHLQPKGNAGVFVSKAESIALPAGDRAGFERLLRAALDASHTQRDLGNAVMRERALWLLGTADDLF